MAIPELGVAYRVESTVAQIKDPNSPGAKAGLQPNDRIEGICYK